MTRFQHLEYMWLHRYVIFDIMWSTPLWSFQYSYSFLRKIFLIHFWIWFNSRIYIMFTLKNSPLFKFWISRDASSSNTFFSAFAICHLLGNHFEWWLFPIVEFGHLVGYHFKLLCPQAWLLSWIDRTYVFDEAKIIYNTQINQYKL